MKFIGQYIQSFIARFRSDVYLEDIDTGTIASGGNLGLDSNNKIVKAAASSGGISHDGSTANGVLTFKDADEATVEANLTFSGNSLNVNGDAEIASDGKLHFRDNYSFINSPSANDLLIAAAADCEIAANLITLDSGGKINLEIIDGDYIDMYNTTNKFASFYAESGAGSDLYMYELGGDSSDDYFRIHVDEHGATTLSTTNAAGATAAHLELDAQGDIILDAAGQIKLEPGTSVLWDSLALTGIQASSESFNDDDVSLMTSKAISDHVKGKYSTSYITFSVKTSNTHGTNYILLHGNGVSGGLVSVNSGVDSATDFGGVTAEKGGGSTETCDIGTASLEQQIPIPETCKLMGFYATASTTSGSGAGDASVDMGVAIWHVPEANVNWGASTAGTATLIHKSDSTLHAENTAHGGANRKKVQKVERMGGTPMSLAAGDIIIPSVFGETADQQITATITLVIATPIKTIT